MRYDFPHIVRRALLVGTAAAVVAAAHPVAAQTLGDALGTPPGASQGMGLGAPAAAPAVSAQSALYPKRAAHVRAIRHSAAVAPSARFGTAMRMPARAATGPPASGNAESRRGTRRSSADTDSALSRIQRDEPASGAAPDAATPVGDSIELTYGAWSALHEHHLAHIAHQRALAARRAATVADAAGPNTLDAMTRDGSTVATPVQPDQGMSIGGAIIRTLISLGLVLALAYAAIAYLKRKGYGASGSALPGAAGAVRPIFGMSPIAQTLLSTAEPSKLRPSARSASPSAQNGIDELEVIARAPLPGSSYTLHKVRVGDRVLLLAGAPGVPLTVLTEWDVEINATDDARFDALLDRMTDPASAPSYTGPAHRAAQRMDSAAKRVAALGSDSRSERMVGPWQA